MKIFPIALALLPLMAHNPRATAAEDPVPVVAVTVTTTEFADEIEALGTLRANESVNLTLTVTELVTEVNFEDGQQVKAGDVLVVMRGFNRPNWRKNNPGWPKRSVKLIACNR